MANALDDMKPLNAFVLRTYLEQLPDDAVIEVQYVGDLPGNGKSVIGITCMASKAILVIK